MKASQFTGFAQHDAQEFMAFLLDGLHEVTFVFIFRRVAFFFANTSHFSNSAKISTMSICDYKNIITLPVRGAVGLLSVYHTQI